MSTMILDFTNYREKSSAKVDPGKYRLQVEDVEQTETRETKDPMIVLYLRIMGGEFDGKTIIDRLPQTERALFRTVQFLEAIGMKVQKKKMKLNLASFIGKVVGADVADGQPYRDQIRSEINNYFQIKKEAEKVEEPEEEDEVEEVENTIEDSPFAGDSTDSADSVDDDLMDELEEL